MAPQYYDSETFANTETKRKIQAIQKTLKN